MISEDQDAVVAFLSRAESHGLAGPVELIETHISRIFLVGDRAFKLKRAVKLPYVDFSTYELRLAACEKEVLFNSPTAPGLYLSVRSIRRADDGQLSFGGAGRPVDAVIEMMRFDQAMLADRMALAGQLTPELMTRIAQMIVQFHRMAPVIHANGGAENIAAVLAINEAGFATSHVFAPAAVVAIGKRFRDRLAGHAARLDRREIGGKVRRCHGDLHLRNICMFNGEPRLFDCIEFSDQIATIDILYDLAFLLMDLWHRGFHQLANLVANRYFDLSDDEDGFALLPFFMAVRAAVRAHVTATQVEDKNPNAAALADEARAYFALADALLDEIPPRLIAIGGLSGSGKSTLGDVLAPKLGMPPGARIIESDRIRKAMHRVSAETRLAPSAYRPEISEKVYRDMVHRATMVLEGGGTVVADAVYDRLADREMIEMVARVRNVNFSGIWLDVEPAVLRHRVAARTGGQSDADLAVLEHQLERTHDEVAWHRLDAKRAMESLIEEIV